MHESWLVSFLHLGFADSGYNSTDVCSEATEMEYLRKVLFEYMMGRETKVRTSHENTSVWPVVAQIYCHDRQRKDARACFQVFFHEYINTNPVIFHSKVIYYPFRRLPKCSDLK